MRPCFPIFTSACCSSAGVGHGPWLPLPAFVPAPPSVGGGSWELGERVPRRRGAGCLERGPLSESRGSKEQAAITSSRPWRSEVVPSPAKGGPRGNCWARRQGPWLLAAPPPSVATGPQPRARAAAAVRPRAARCRSPGASEVSSEVPIPALRSPRAGVVQPRLCGSALWSSHLHRGSAFEASTSLSRGGEDWREGAKTSAGA